SLRVIRLFRFLQAQRDPVTSTLIKQLLRSSTSIGANITEAKSGESRRDFVHKYSIAQKEARESLYWLKLLLKADLLPATRLEPLIQETNEIIAIITTIIKKAKAAHN